MQRPSPYFLLRPTLYVLAKAILSFFILIFKKNLSGWYFEYLELPIQGRTEIPQNNNCESRVVRDSYCFTESVCLYVTNPILSSCIFVAVGSFINMAYLSWRNKVKKRPGVRAKLLQKYVSAEKGIADDGGLRAWIELGDRHPDFVYTI